MNKDFEGLLYFKDSSQGKPVNINIDNNTIRIAQENGEYSLPISESNFKLGGEANSFLIISGHDLTIFIKDISIFDELIVKSGSKSEEIKKLKEQFITSKKNKKYTPAYILITIVVLIGIVYGSLVATTYAVSRSFPLSWEKKIGDWAAPQIVGTKKVNDKDINSSIEQIGKYLQLNSGNTDYNFKFYVVKSDEVNAFALPGGHVIVNTALIEKSDSHEEVAGVIAHELQHVYQRHGVEKIINRMGISFTLMMLLGDVGGVVDMIGGELISLKFSRDEESEADRLGMELMYKSGINPEGMISFFRKLESINKEMSDIPDFISTHPNTKQRINDLENLAKTKYSNLPVKKVFNFDWKEIKAKVKAL